MLCLQSLCGLNVVLSEKRALHQRLKEKGEEEEEEVVMGLSGDCLFVVFTAKPLRTYRHFHQHSAEYNTRFPALLLMSYSALTLLCI